MDTINNDLRLFQSLIGKFYEATISPDEMRLLNEVADRLASSQDNVLQLSDPELSADISLIRSLRDFSVKSSEDLTNATPPGLEERLESHIHNLAVSENNHRRSLAFKKIIGWGAAAAVVATLITGGLRYSANNDTHIPVTNRTTVIAQAVTNGSSFNAIQSPTALATEEESLIEEQPLTATQKGKANRIYSNLSSQVEPASSFTDDSPEDMSYPEEDVNDDQMLAEESQDNPEMLLTNMTDEPMTASAEAERTSTLQILPLDILPAIDPTQSLKLPLTTLSAGIDNVFRSFSLLSESLTVALSPSYNTEEDSVSPSIPTQPI